MFTYDILESSDISRKTFYYNFLDKQDLVIWIFRTSLAREIEATFDKSLWIREIDITTKSNISFVNTDEYRSTDPKIRNLSYELLKFCVDQYKID
ncbi:MAG TPA: hypothetical protein VM577_14475 [Anaerovoracaceae bacterium]|nr:hypothetical protein [Anaerovoracaceae bacterium]